MNVITITVICLLFTNLETKYVPEDYDTLRHRILDEELSMSLGGKLKLTKEEQEVNQILMRWKHKEVDEGFHNPQKFNLSGHFFKYRELIKTSKVYQMIRKMPKGAALHVHSSYMLDADRMIELTYEDHCYACYHYDLKLHFSDDVPELDCPVKWTLLSDLRATSDNVTLFDEKLKKHLTLVTDNENLMYENINDVWNRFETLHAVIKSLISYRPVRQKYIRKVLESFFEDNVMYIEIRTGLNKLYELDGTVHDEAYMAKLYKDITDEFIEEHPDFIGIKLIISNYRQRTPEGVQEKIHLAEKVKTDMPELLAGFDLIGQEDLGRPLHDFVPVIKDTNDKMDFYFHAGETAWFGLPSDENLIDAVLVDARRIGHAYALLKHPRVLQAVIKKDIGLEVNVISNAVLALVQDVRNHPLATFLALGLPVVLSSDDPGAWGADPLSHDFYVSFVAVASRNYDLRLLKQLALNSIKYSALDAKGKIAFTELFHKKWKDFISEIRGLECDVVGHSDQSESGSIGD